MTRRPNSLTTTGGSDEREARSLIGAISTFDLAQEASRLRGESAYTDGDRNARTLVKTGGFRLVLLAFRTGAAFDESEQRGTLALHVLEGRLALRVGEDAMEVAEGEVAVVAVDHPWAARAVADGLLLIHLSWPPEPGSVRV